MKEEQVELTERLQTIMEVIVEETRSNPRFARRLGQVLKVAPDEADDGKLKPRRNRRDPPSVDPFALYEKSEDHLRHALAELSLDQLKDIVAGHRMPQLTLALKWKTPARLVELIVETVKTRSHKGDAFRT
ncbi:MAG: hypothetical protein OXK78_15935 [Caldilineaceae bacterium]|nr:hypothetical protein [Caldilineaceae bacterium]